MKHYSRICYTLYKSVRLSLKFQPGSSSSKDIPHLTSNDVPKLPFKCFSQSKAPVASASGEQMFPVTLDVPVCPDFKVVAGLVTSVL